MNRAWYSLYGQLLSLKNLYEGYRQVKRAKGAGGVDGQSLSEFDDNLLQELKQLQLELKEKRYKPLPVKRVTIAKEGGGERLLGIPSVRDRVVQQTLRNILEPIYDLDFHPSSYGYRKGRSCHHAISKAELFIRRYHRRWVVDMDLSKCFDTLDHEIIIAQFRKKVSDGSILGLLKLFLHSGVMIGDSYEATTTGSPQGGVISPLIANVYLDRFDQMMKQRGHRIVRYADDILILCCSQAAAKNALRVASGYLEEDLKLQVNKTKTHMTHSRYGINYLGVKLYTNYTAIQKKKLISFKDKVKQITRRNNGYNLAQIIARLNPVLRGFVNYFRIANCKGELKKLMAWVRRRLRCVQLKQWKKPAKLHRRLKQLGYKPPFKLIRMSSWRNASCPLAHYAMSINWFHETQKLVDMTQVQTGISVPMIGDIK